MVKAMLNKILKEFTTDWNGHKKAAELESAITGVKYDLLKIQKKNKCPKNKGAYYRTGYRRCL